MTKETIITDLAGLVGDVLAIDNLKLEMDTIAKDVEGWDSISYIEIIAEVENHFNVKFKLLELESFEKIGDMVSNIAEKMSH